MKIIGIAGSNSSTSINKKLVQYALTHFKHAETELFDMRDFEVPIYSPEREVNEGIPEKIIGLAEKISSSDLVILSLAEHNGSYSVAFKNTYDWFSRIPNRMVWDDKNLLLMATSPGPRGGQGVLEAAANRFPRDGAKLIGTLSLPSFGANYSENQGVTDEIFIAHLIDAIHSL